MLMHKQGYMSLAKKEEGAETTIGSPRNSNEKVEVGGWRMIKNDVFIPPKFRGVLSSLVGNGFHLLAIVVVECLSQFIGVFDKYGDGSLINAAVYYCPAMMINGFISSHVYKTMRGEEWGSLMFLSGFFFSVRPYLTATRSHSSYASLFSPSSKSSTNAFQPSTTPPCCS